MNYIESLTLENFQSHKKTTIIPAPSGQLTVIVGPSDSGKTAIIRGLKLLAYNSPSGIDYIQVGSQSAAVSAIMEDGTKVSRERSRGGVNRYLLGKQKYEGFGVGNPPLEIRQALGISPIDIGDQSFNLNLSEQLDGPFLGNSVPVTAKAKVLGKLSGVEEIDYAGKTLGTDIYRKKRDKEGYENQVRHLTEEIEGYTYLDELEPLIDLIEKQVVRLKEKQSKKEKLSELKLCLVSTRAAITQEEQKIASLCNINDAYTTLNGTESKQQRLQRLTRSRNELNSIIPQIRNSEDIVEATKDIDSIALVVSAASEKYNKLTSLRALLGNRNTYKAELSSIQVVLEATQGISETLETVEKLYDKSEKLYALKLKKKSLEWIQKDMLYNNKVLENTQNIDDLLAKTEELTAKVYRTSGLKVRRDLCKQKKDEIEEATRQIGTFEKTVESLTKDLTDLFMEAGTCPMCGSEMNLEKLKEVI